MSKIFSFAGNFASFMHIYQQLYTTEEFQDFTDYLNEGEPKEVLLNFIRNLLFKQIDPVISSYLENPELTQIMSNEKMIHQDKCKIVGGKITNYVLDNHPYFDTKRTDPDMTFGFIANKRQMIEDTLESMDHMEKLNQVVTVNDVYTVVINDLAKSLSETLYSLITNVVPQITEEDGLGYVKQALQLFNTNYEYQSRLCNDDLIDHNSDDNDDNDDSSDSDEDEGDEIHTPENKKRKFGQIADGDDAEKPANKKNKKK